MGRGSVIDCRRSSMKEKKGNKFRDPDQVYSAQRRTATAIAMFLMSTLFFYLVGVVTTVVLLFNFLFR